ncbi:MAG: hypothetical protein HW391_110 [Chloroflexi bacterium]|nr:hypothetical protein [Chloroflexota bacterium]
MVPPAADGPLAEPQGTNGSFPPQQDGRTIGRMQVIVPSGPVAGDPRRLSEVRALAVGAFLIAGATLLAWLVLATGFLGQFTPSGRASTAQLVVGALAWGLGLIAPAVLGLLGVLRVGSAVGRIRARRHRVTPAVRAAGGISDDYAVATLVRLPDGSRVLPEVVVGPFGAAVIEELPPARAVVSRGARSWEVRVADGQIRRIDHPLERASRDAERVRAWFSGEDADHVVKVYAAVVGTDPVVVRSASCAYIAPDQVAAWIASLPPQRSFDADRRDRVIRLVRAAL